MGIVDYLVTNGIILSETRGGVETDYIADPLGSTADLMSTAGAITDTFTYWPYRQLRSHVGSSVTPCQYCGTLGYYTDGTSGRVYVDARLYSPSVTRWLTVDPFWPDEQSYVYVYSNPLSLTDSTGPGPGSSSYDPGFWNKPGTISSNNYYNYACNDPGNDFRQPGDLSGTKHSNFTGGPPSCAHIVDNAIRDGLFPVDSHYKSGCPAGFHKVCVYVTTEVSGHDDYHWYRQDGNGYWSSKPGRTAATNCYDIPGRHIPITNPGADAGLRGYYRKCKPCLCAHSLIYFRTEVDPLPHVRIAP